MKDGVALIFGWLGSQNRQVSKYSNMYQKLGLTPIVLRPTILETAIPILQDLMILKFMKHVLGNPHIDSSTPLFLSVMSNAGYVALGSLLLATFTPQHSTRLLQNLSSSQEQQQTIAAFRKVLLQTRGIVIDSAPSSATSEIWSTGMTSAAFQVPAASVHESHTRIVNASRTIADIYLKSAPIQNRLKNIQNAWNGDARLQLARPELFLYSKGDTLIPYQHVEAFIEQQKQLGIAVESHRFEESGHCEHLKIYPDEYPRLVKNFLQKHLDSSS